MSDPPELCSRSLGPREFGMPKAAPPAVWSWWWATGMTFFGNPHHPQTLVLPPSVYSWWSATGSSLGTVSGLQIEEATTTVQVMGGASSTLATTSDQSQSVPPAVPLTTETSHESSSTGHGTPHAEAITPAPSSPPISCPPTKIMTSSGSSLFEAPTVGPTPSPLPSDSPTITSSSSALAAKSKNKAIPIAIGVVVPLVLIILGVVAFILYKRRQRARDRREWERTHEAIADAVRQVGAPAAAGLPAWNPALGDMKELLDGDTAPLFDKSA
ncbi:hypothetical protein MVEN_00952200 [Mycena venus]|uniref:Mid2 domain-containing protein n=1 Tax=Mycena venus TaxID=2733690 RepID=A0A8H6Y8D1_9AGAR|nr:hypothetical protein MVEN_00952200 [Mycena venus]